MMLVWIGLACGKVSEGPPVEAVILDPLQLVQVVPDHGSVLGGDVVRLQGRGFDESSVIAVNDEMCVSSHLVSDVEMTCMTPPLPMGDGDIAITRGTDGVRSELPFSIVDSDSDSDTDADADADVDSGMEPGTGTELTPDYCHIQWPCSMTSLPDTVSEPVYTVVYTLDVTDRPGPGDGVEVQVGVGAKETVPNEEWVWSSCTFNIDTDGGAEGDRANDEFVGQFVSPAVPGAYAFSARTRIDGGAWLLCDLGGDSCGGSGSDDGYSPFTAGEVLVTGP